MRRMLALVVLGVVVLGVVLTAVALTACGKESVAASSTTASPAVTLSPSPLPTPTVHETVPPPLFDTPSLDEFRVTLKTLSKQCFGSIGCNWEVRLQLHELADLNLDPSVTYELTYRLTGDEGGPIIGTIEVNGDSYTVDNGEVAVSTNRNSVVPKATLTALEEQ